MKILHTSDLHIGKRLMDRERLPEQIEALDEIAEICERENVSLVLIAGDVYDTYLPSAEAEDAFFRAMKKIAGEKRAVVIVSGNHDDGVRLSASAPLAEEQGIYIFGNRPRITRVGGDRPVRAVEAGEYYLIVEDEQGERVYINALPYPNEARFREDKTDESFPEKMKRWIARGEEGFRGDMFHILLTHLFVAGGKTSESERDIDLGGARAVPLSCLPQEGYVALGHLHKKQQIGNARYSGSILQYSFDEAEQKSVILLETHEKTYTAREIPLHTGKRLVRLEAVGFENALSLLSSYENCYIELTLHLGQPLTSTETHTLREANEGLVSLIVRVNSGETPTFISRSALSAEELFTEYYQLQYGEEPKKELKTAFLQLLEEA